MASKAWNRVRFGNTPSSSSSFTSIFATASSHASASTSIDANPAASMEGEAGASIDAALASAAIDANPAASIEVVAEASVDIKPRRRLRIESASAHADNASNSTTIRLTLPGKSASMKPAIDRYGRLIIFGINQTTGEWDSLLDGRSALVLYHVVAVADEVGANGVLEWYDHVEIVGIAFEDETPAGGAPQWHDSHDILPHRTARRGRERLQLHHADFYGYWDFADHLIGQYKLGCRKSGSERTYRWPSGGCCAQCEQQTGYASDGWRTCPRCSPDPRCPTGWVPGANVRQLRTNYVSAHEQSFPGHTRADCGSATISSDEAADDGESGDGDAFPDDDGSDGDGSQPHRNVAHPPLYGCHILSTLGGDVAAALQATASGAFTPDSGFSEHGLPNFFARGGFAELDADLHDLLPGAAAAAGAKLAADVMAFALTLTRECFADPRLKAKHLQPHHNALMFFHGVYNQPGGVDTLIVVLDAMGKIVKVFVDEADLPNGSALESEVKDQEFYSRPRRFGKSAIPAHLRAILSRVVVLLEFCDSLLSKAFMKDFYDELSRRIEPEWRLFKHSLLTSTHTAGSLYVSGPPDPKKLLTEARYAEIHKELDSKDGCVDKWGECLAGHYGEAVPAHRKSFSSRCGLEDVIELGKASVTKSPPKSVLGKLISAIVAIVTTHQDVSDMGSKRKELLGEYHSLFLPLADSCHISLLLL